MWTLILGKFQRNSELFLTSSKRRRLLFSFIFELCDYSMPFDFFAFPLLSSLLTPLFKSQQSKENSPAPLIGILTVGEK